MPGGRFLGGGQVSRRVWLARSLGAVGAALAARQLPAEARPPDPLPPPPPLPLDVAVAALAAEAGAAPVPVRDRAWVDAQIAEAMRLYVPHGVSFALAGVRALDGRHAHLEDRDDRDGLAPEIHPRVINVFVVASLRDVDDTSRMLRGVHWRYRKNGARRYVILSASAGPSTLAHELGHYLGNPHTSVVDNLMSYQRSDGGSVFVDDPQGKRALGTARRLLRSKELVPLAP